MPDNGKMRLSRAASTSLSRCFAPQSLRLAYGIRDTTNTEVSSSRPEPPKRPDHHLLATYFEKKRLRTPCQLYFGME